MLFLLASVVSDAPRTTRLGGFSSYPKEQLSDDIRAVIAARVKSELNAADFEVLSVQTQVVAGINYKVEFRVGERKYAAGIWRKLDKTMQLTYFNAIDE